MTQIFLPLTTKNGIERNLQSPSYAWENRVSSSAEDVIKASYDTITSHSEMVIMPDDF